MKVLIVDDELIIRQGICKIIKEKFSDLEILEAQDGVKAYDIFLENNIDIIIMDINMPKIDGLTLSEKIKKEKKDIKIIIISGYDEYEYMKKAIQIKIDDYLLKPTTKDEIIEVIKRMIKQIEKNKNQQRVESILSDYIDKDIEETDNDLMNKIDALINEEYDKNYFTLNYLSDKLTMNLQYLSRVIKKHYGISFINYITKKRIEKAKILLLTTNLKNYEISEKIGMDNEGYYFATLFKKYTNKTPKEFRKNVKETKK